MKKLLSIILLLFIINIIIAYEVNQGIDLLISIITALVIYAVITLFITRIFKNDKNYISIIFYIIAALVLGQGVIFFTYTKSISSDENRKLAQFPDVNPFHEEFAEDMDRYINDRIGLREYALTIYKRMNFFDKLNLSNNVIAGKEGWLFLNSESDNFKYFQRAQKYTPDKLNAVKALIEKNTKFCQDNGIELIIIIPPNKSTIYPEYYNKYIGKTAGKDNYLILKDYLNKKLPNAHIVMPYDELMNDKENNMLYHKTDTHWNTYGAFYAYKSLEKEIKKVNKEYALLDESRIKKCEKDVLYDLEILRNNVKSAGKKYESICINGIDNITLKPNNKAAIWHKGYGGEKAPKILLIHDSFMKELAPFISTGVSSLWHLWTYDADFTKLSDVILESKPDIIIWERLERYWFN
ncbi:MAG: DHHW family protein [Candidatus Mucispirillum faecigallinarum]|nr:DHHW family protein [Candidatus Mucispirillum faecigallinarum]